MENVSVMGIDLAKNVIEICGQDASGTLVLRRRLPRGKLLGFLANRLPCLIGMEACGGAYHWAREIGALGHSVRLVPAQYVKGYAQGNKTDRNDALAICEAVQRPRVPEVAVKTPEQQALQTYLHTRRQLIGQRTALSNAMRGYLQEFGRVTRRGVPALRALVTATLGDDALPAVLREALQIQWSQYLSLCESIEHMDRRIRELAHRDATAVKLMEVPGVGEITAVATLTSVGDAHAFRSGRQMAASLGIVPKQHSSGDSRRLQGISKRGDVYLRTLIIHGARAALKSRRTDRQVQWAKKLERRIGTNKATVALANKTTRILWRLMVSDVNYRAQAA